MVDSTFEYAMTYPAQLITFNLCLEFANKGSYALIISDNLKIRIYLFFKSVCHELINFHLLVLYFFVFKAFLYLAVQIKIEFGACKTQFAPAETQVFLLKTRFLRLLFCNTILFR
jgi:hypothetical protein